MDLLNNNKKGSLTREEKSAFQLRRNNIDPIYKENQA